MKKLTILISFVMFFILLPGNVQANEESVPFSINAELPGNQVNMDVSYFDIEMAPGHTQSLEVTLYNSSDEEIELNISANFAGTNSNGIITYDGSIENIHESMQYPFSEIATVEEETVTIAAASEETAVIEVEAPDESFDGVILGGIYVTMEPDDDADEQAVSIVNQYAYALAVQISETENDTEVEPALEFDNVSAELINHRTGVQSTFSNPTPVIIHDLNMTAEIIDAESDEVLFTREEENFNVAPNTTFNFPISFDNERLEAGEYIFKLTAENEDESWTFEETFEITEEEAVEVNEDAVELTEETDNTLMYVLIGVGAVVALLLIFVIILLVRRKK